MTRLLVVTGVLAASLLGVAGAAQASCISQTPAEQRARADAIFNGIALDDPTTTGVQRFRVTRYLKGRGPAIVRVRTGHRVRPDGTGSTTSVSIVVRKGQRWRIFARGTTRAILVTSVCDGSRALRR